jgi:hypothetical protein
MTKNKTPAVTTTNTTATKTKFSTTATHTTTTTPTTNPTHNPTPNYTTITSPPTIRRHSDFAAVGSSVNKDPPSTFQQCFPCEANDKSTIDHVIVDNLVSFLAHDKKGGPDSYITKVMKNALLTACTFSQSKSRLNDIRVRLGMTKRYFWNFIKEKSDFNTNNNIHSDNL